MNWDAIGAVGETVGALAVVITLAYLALQIRYTHRVAADASRQFRANGVMGMALTMATNDQFRATWKKSFDDEAVYTDLARELDLTPDEARVMDFCFLYFVWLHWAQFYSVTTQGDKDELDNLVRTFYGIKPMSVYLRKSPYVGTLDPRWVEYLEQTSRDE